MKISIIHDYGNLMYNLETTDLRRDILVNLKKIGIVLSSSALSFGMLASVASASIQRMGSLKKYKFKSLQQNRFHKSLI